MTCTTCGTDNPSTLLYCQECGQRLGARAAPPTLPPPGKTGPGSDSQGSQDKVPCGLCGHRNLRNLRFCVTCGHLLGVPSLAPPAPAPALAAAPTLPPPGRARGSSRPPPPPPPPASRVADPGASVPEAMLRLCSRCRAGSDPTSQFCRFCGASLADGSTIALAPRVPSSNPPPGPVAPWPSTGAPSTPRPPEPSALVVRATVEMVSPAPSSARAHLVLIARDGGEGSSYALGEVADIGRTEGTIIVADDRYVSPRHARISIRAGAHYVRDLGSTNGVFLRIPFARRGAVQGTLPTSQTTGPQAAAQATGGMPGAAGCLPSGARSGSPPERGEPRDTQALLDQDLLLVGQEVLKFEVVKHAEAGFGVASENGTLVFGTPTAPRYARLSQRTVEGVVRDVFYVKQPETVIGREVGDIVFTDDPFLSRRHAVVRVHDAAAQGAHRGAGADAPHFTVADLGSSNGTFLQLREEVCLKDGDHLRIGQQLFRFDIQRLDA